MAPSTIAQTTECLDDNTLAAFVGGQVEPAEAERLRAHLDACTECHRLAAVLARGFFEAEDRNGTLLSPGQARDEGVAAVSGMQAKKGRRLPAGIQLGRYVLGETLGEGGMGVVYAARDPELGRNVALKVMGHTTGEPASQRKRLLREARAAARLHHPNVVTIFDVGETDDATYLVMELVAGTSLRGKIGDASVPFARRILWLCEVARALSAAHRQDLVHRDIKPENVMLQSDGAVKVVDFGIARRLDAQEDPADAVVGSTLTAEGALIGTPMYMAPEQLRGESVDARCDQFAWGVLAYELLTGERPWSGQGVALVSQILGTDLPRARLADGAPLPEAIEATLRKATAKAPADRFRSMEDIVAAFAPYATEERAGQRGRAGDVGKAAVAAFLILAAAALAGLALRARAPSSTAVAVHTVAPISPAPIDPTASASTPPPTTAVDTAKPTSPAPAEPPAGPPRRTLPNRPAGPSKAASIAAASASAANPGAASTSPSAPTGRCDPPFTWQAGVKVPKPDCPLD